eukprot:CAMPEP_0194313132 /NCGR_PEP_ID=MMETSP0171-20130528/10032_1 /TAXON_ID=218684 /ORGANISM="Corethron pennatum, Strain L29A3" /LENGTH=74 /DNA_ID=CAMNT_0039067959 /DNA_START=57 /DNA_END=281 /DNA_ORIENTATION=-
MPWQTAPGLIIIGGAFCLAGTGLRAVHKLAFGEERKVRMDEWTFELDKRNKRLAAERILSERKEAARLAAEKSD